MLRSVSSHLAKDGLSASTVARSIWFSIFDSWKLEVAGFHLKIFRRYSAWPPKSRRVEADSLSTCMLSSSRMICEELSMAPDSGPSSERSQAASCSGGRSFWPAASQRLATSAQDASVAPGKSFEVRACACLGMALNTRLMVNGRREEMRCAAFPLAGFSATE